MPTFQGGSNDNNQNHRHCIDRIVVDASVGIRDVNTDDWVKMCESKNGAQRGWCLGTPLNTMEIIERNDNASRHRLVCQYKYPDKVPRKGIMMRDCIDRDLCPDEGKKAVPVVDIVIAYYRQHPMYADQPMQALIIAALLKDAAPPVGHDLRRTLDRPRY